MTKERRFLIQRLLDTSIFLISIILIFSLIFIIFKSFTNAYDGARIKVKADYITLSNFNLRVLFPNRMKDTFYWNSFSSLFISLVTLIISKRIISSNKKDIIISSLNSLSIHFLFFSVLKMFIYISKHNMLKISPTAGLPFLVISLLIYTINNVLKEKL